MASKHERSKMDQQIDENLKRVYDDALSEQLPDKFLNLINQLKQSDAKKDTDPDAK